MASIALNSKKTNEEFFSSNKKMTREEFLALRQAWHKNASLNVAKKGYRLILTPHFEHSSTMTKEEHAAIDKLNEPIEFDLVRDKSVTASSDVTEYPTVQGDTIADHMIKKATTMRVAGTFSLYGNKPSTFNGADDRLTNVQTFFERLKDEGIMCTLTTIDRASNSRQRFKTRNNMVLNAITWVESQSSMEFDFGFTEALTVNMISPTPDYTDENVPTITDPSTMNFTDEFLDPDKITSIILQKLQEVKLLDDDFAVWMSENVDVIRQFATITSLASIALGATIISSMISVSISAAALGLATNPVGWVIGAAFLVVGAVYAFVSWLCNQSAIKKTEREYGIKAFKRKDNDEENEQEAQRLCNYIGQVNQRLNVLNDSIQVFAVQASIEQECMLYIGSKYYIFTFTKNNTQTEDTQTTWKLNVAFSDKDESKDVSDICAASLSNIKDCTLDNMILKTDDGIWIYLINNKLDSVENAAYNSEEERSKAIADCKSDLTSYAILASKTNMQEFCDKMQDIVVEAMKA